MGPLFGCFVCVLADMEARSSASSLCDNVNEMVIHFPAHSNAKANYKIHDTISVLLIHVAILSPRWSELFCSFLNLLRSAGTQRTGEALLLFFYIMYYYVERMLIWNYLVLLCVRFFLFFFFLFLPVLCYAMQQQWVIQAVQWWWVKEVRKWMQKSIRMQNADHKFRLAELQTNTDFQCTTFRDPNVIYTEHYVCNDVLQSIVTQ